MQCPMTKLQFPKKLQLPSSNSASRGVAGGNWELGIHWTLDIGNWKFATWALDVRLTS
jgi:hypothetical protein